MPDRSSPAQAGPEQPANISITNRREPNSPRLIGRLKPAPTYLLRAMQALTPDSFCPLTDPQPYQRDRAEPPSALRIDVPINRKLTTKCWVRSSDWLGDRRALLRSVEWRGQTPLCEHDAKAQARLAAELLRFDKVLDEDASIRFDDAL